MDEKAKMAAEVDDMNQLYEKVRDNAGLLGKARSKSFRSISSEVDVAIHQIGIRHQRHTVLV